MPADAALLPAAGMEFGFLLKGRKTRGEVVEHELCEAGADAADMLQVAVLVGDGEDQRADPAGAAALAGAPPGDDDLLHPLVLDLAPKHQTCWPAGTGRATAVSRLVTATITN
jgi:hypothetical protein